MKKLSIIVFTIYSIFLVLFITFGTSAIQPIYSFLYNFIIKQEYKITKIEINLENEYLIERQYFLDYTVYPNKNIDYELTFESLTPEILTVTSDGYICGKRTNNEKSRNLPFGTFNAYHNSCAGSRWINKRKAHRLKEQRGIGVCHCGTSAKR